MGAPRASRWVLLAGLLVVVAAIVLMLRADDPGEGASATPLARSDRTEPAPWDPSTLIAPDNAPASMPTSAAGVPVESAAVATDGATSLLVRVTWASDGQPAADVGLRIFSWTGPDPHRYVRVARTNARGEWFAPDIRPGLTTAYADRGGSQSATLVRGEASQIDVIIPAGVRVRGLVTTDAQEPVADADVYILGSILGADDDLVHAAVRSDAAGRFELRDVQLGAWLQARSRVFSPSRRVQLGGEVALGAEVTLVLGLPGCTVRGTVMDIAGDPVAGALVRVGPAAWPAVFVQSDDAGGFLAEGVRTGWVPIAAIAPGHSPAEKRVEIGEGETAEVALQLGPSTRLSGQVRDAQGQARANVDVSIGERGDMLRSEASTDGEGRYALVDIAPGSREVTAEHVSAGRASVRLRFKAGDSANWDPVLGSGSRISGTILDDSGAPATSLRVEARPIDEGTRGRSQTSTDAAGAFELQDVPAGPQRLIARGGALGELEIELLSPVEPGTRDLLLRLPAHFEEPGRIAGRLVDPQGGPVAGKIIFTNVATGASWKALADRRTGRFEAGPLPLGHYETEAWPEGRPDRTFPEVDVPAGETADVGDLVVPAGGRIVAHISAPGPISGSPSLGTFVHCRGKDSEEGAAFELADGAWYSSPVPPGVYELIISTRHYAAPHRDVVVEEGRDTDVHVDLLPGVRQELRFFATPSADADGTIFDLAVRTPAGQVAWDLRHQRIPHLDRPAEAEGSPLAAFVVVLQPGTYVVDVTLGQRTLTAVSRTTDAATPWEFDLR